MKTFTTIKQLADHSGQSLSAIHYAIKRGDLPTPIEGNHPDESIKRGRSFHWNLTISQLQLHRRSVEIRKSIQESRAALEKAEEILNEVLA